MAGERKDLLDQSEVAADSEELDEHKYLEVKGKGSNWVRGVGEQIFLVSAIDPSLMKRKFSTLHF